MFRGIHQTFHDVTSGANGYDHVTGFTAGPGYDMASGLGTPNARSIVPTLCGGAPIPAAAASAPATSTAANASAARLHASGITLAKAA